MRRNKSVEEKVRQKRISKINYRVGLKPAEAILIVRKRLGWSQAKMAEKYNMGLTIYKKVEHGQCGMPRIFDSALAVFYSEPLHKHEMCLIHRKRAGKSQSWTARKMKVCPYTIRRMEQAERRSEPLLEFWESR